jgi:hypothetical protein
MKKIPFIVFSFIVLLSASSCNKTWNCVCSSAGKVLQVTPIKSLGKMGAKNVCSTYQDENNRNGARQVCVIK